MRNIKLIYIVLLIIVFGTSFFLYSAKDKLVFNVSENSEHEVKVEALIPGDRKEFIRIEEGDTYGVLMEKAGISVATANEIYNASIDKYDLAKIRVGRDIELLHDYESDSLINLVYKIDSEEEIIVKKNNLTATTTEWISEIKLIEYEVKIVVKEGTVETSMYEAALENDIDERAIIELANAFQWTIDFAMDPRAGDNFKFVYEERYLDGEYKMPGKILAGVYINDGEKYEVYYFEESEENIGYFDKDGNSAQKMFLKAPVAFKYISSGFTTGARYIEAFNISTGHRAIDYAAEYGTPIRSVGDGSVIFASWNGSYGNMVKIRHNGTYQTNYGHMSRFAVKKGAKVSQGDVIGYVGSTGLSTGPHVHFEMVKNGVKINPLQEVLPPGKPILEENRERFFSEINGYSEMINL